MKDVLTPLQARAVDQSLMADHGYLGLELMERAAEGVLSVIRSRFSPPSRILVVCGSGNNGGDGLAVLRLLHNIGYSVSGWMVGDTDKLPADARTNLLRAKECGCDLLTACPEFNGYCCIVDALFGTGLSRDLSEDICSLIERINRSVAWKIAVDIPSGIDGRTGQIRGAAIKANETVTFQYPKHGLLLFPGRNHTGLLHVHPIAPIYPLRSNTSWLEESDIAALLPPRPLDSHKGKNGRALLCAGSIRYTGAALLSAKASLRGGCGLLTVAVPALLKPAFSALPEAMCIPCGTSGDWDADAQIAAAELLSEKTAIGIGCGMGEMSDDTLLASALRTGLPCVIDADALNLMARKRALLQLLHANCVITPHPAEMARLLQANTEEIVGDPIAVSRMAARTFGCMVVLKRATTCLSDGEHVWLNTTGNAGLAKGGSGDVLTGVLLALLAQGLSPKDAACAAAYLLGASADRALCLLGNRVLIAGDVVDALNQEIHAALSH